MTTGIAGSTVPLSSTASARDRKRGSATDRKTGNGSVPTQESEHNNIEIRKDREKISEEEVKDVVAEGSGMQSFNSIPKIEISPSKGKRFVSYLNGDYLSETVRVKTEFGILKIIRQHEKIHIWQLKLKRAKVPDQVISDLAADVRWPQGTNGSILSQASGGALFIRDPTPDEEKGLLQGTELSRNSTTITLGREIGTEGPEDSTAASFQPRAVSKGNIYKINVDKSTITPLNQTSNSRVSTQSSVNCDNVGICCAADLFLAYPHCAAAAVACNATGSGSLAFVIAVVNLCIPSVALISLSGCCEKVYNNCLPSV